MHCLIAILYAAIIWLSCLAYALIVGGRWGLVLAFTPFIVSGAAAAILTLDALLSVVIEAFRRSRKVKRPV